MKVFFQVTSYVVLDLTPNIEYTYQVRLSPLNLILWQLSSNLTKRDVTYIFKLMLMDFTEWARASCMPEASLLWSMWLPRWRNTWLSKSKQPSGILAFWSKTFSERFLKWAQLNVGLVCSDLCGCHADVTLGWAKASSPLRNLTNRLV